MRAFVAAIAILVATSAHATSSLGFEAGGYVIDIVVGDDARPGIASLSIAAPGSKQPMRVPMQRVKIDVFDSSQKILLLRFTNTEDRALPPSFRLTVKGDVGTLHIGGRSMAGSFSWGM